MKKPKFIEDQARLEQKAREKAFQQVVNPKPPEAEIERRNKETLDSRSCD